MTIVALIIAAKAAALKILIAVFTLLPAPLAYAFYKGTLSTLPAKRPLNWNIYCRLAIHIVIAFIIIATIVYALGQECPHDEDGTCYDDDWKQPTAKANLINFIRLSILCFGGMLWAFGRWFEKLEYK